jgi:hypothetical protein
MSLQRSGAMWERISLQQSEVKTLFIGRTLAIALVLMASDAQLVTWPNECP